MILSLNFPLDPGIMTTVRLATGGVCALAGFGIEDTEDCKVCVTESLLLLLHGGAESASLVFERGEKLNVVIEAEHCRARNNSEEEISVALLSALAENFHVSAEGDVTRISFGFGKL